MMPSMEIESLLAATSSMETGVRLFVINSADKNHPGREVSLGPKVYKHGDGTFLPNWR